MQKKEGTRARGEKAPRTVTSKQWLEKEKGWIAARKRMKEQITKLQDSLECSQEESSVFQEQIADLHLQLAHLHQSTELLEKEKQECMQVLESAKLESTDKSSQIAVLERVVETTTTSLEAERNRADSLEKKLNGKGLELVEAVAAREQFETQNVELVKMLEKAREQNEKTSSEGVALKVKSERLKQSQSAALELIEQERSTFTSVVNKKKREIASLKQALKQQSGVLHSQVNNLQDEIATLQVQKLSLSKRLHSGGKSLDQIEHGVSRCFNSFATHMNHVVSDKEMFKAHELRRWQSLRATLQSLRVEFAELATNLQKKLEAETKAKDSLARELESAFAQVDKYKSVASISTLHHSLLSKIFEEAREGWTGTRLCLSKVRRSEFLKLLEDARTVRSNFSEIPLVCCMECGTFFLRDDDSWPTTCSADDGFHKVYKPIGI